MQTSQKSITNIKSLPPDILTIIFSFGYPQYKENMKEICHEITHFTGHGLLQYNLYLLRKDYYNLFYRNFIGSILDYVTYTVDDQVLENLFIQCTKCHCCSKHCHNRPKNYYTDEVSIGENFNTDEQCHCTCRSISRTIKRMQSIELSESKTYKKKKKCRKKSTFNIQFIPLSNRIHRFHAQFHQVNPPSQP